jgi:methylmalonyl-CoA/ethylmalonyl-CoA epimerase
MRAASARDEGGAGAGGGPSPLRTRRPRPHPARGRNAHRTSFHPGRRRGGSTAPSCPHAVDRLAGVFRRIDHIGVAVAEIEASLALWRDGFQMEVAHREVVQEQGVEAVLLDVGENHIELLAPLGEDTPVGKFLAKQGPGLHHVAYQVGDIDATLATLKDAGMELIDEQPRVGIRGSRVAFLHPRATAGVLTEIVEPAAGLGAH